MQHLRSVVAVCEMTMQHLQSPVAVCETTTQHLHSLVAVCETTTQHLHSVVAVCETATHHLHSVVAVCEAITQHLRSPFVMCAPTRVQSFIPAGCLGGECNSPLHGYPAKLRCPRRGRPYHGDNHSSLRDVWGAYAFVPLHVSGKLRCPRRGRPYTGTRQTWQASLMPPPNY